VYGGVRRYDENDLRRLRFIRSAQAAGFTLEQIAELLALDATDDRARARELASERIAALDARIAEMTRARDSLRKLARECGGGGAGPCPILAAFDHN
ncbi:MAG: MerR family transcriptional regulator, partial [Sphingomonadales bacterium]